MDEKQIDSGASQKPKEKNPHEGHRDRLRQQFLKNGAEGMEVHQVLEMLLHNVIPRCDTNEIAHRLIDRFGSFSAVLDARLEDLAEVKGMGMKSAVFLKMLPGISRVYTDDKYKNGRSIQSVSEIGEFLVRMYEGCANERFYLVCMDRTCRILQTVLVAEGSAEAVLVETRDVVEKVLGSQASCVVLSHNHPLGFAIPSAEDIATTLRLVEGLALINVTVNDHIIVAGDDFVSMAQSQQYRHLFRPKQ